MIRSAFVMMTATAGTAAAATFLVALGWWNVRGDQAPATALGIALALFASGTVAAILGCRLYPRCEAASMPSVTPSISAAGQGS
jgi:hypothetical protein